MTKEQKQSLETLVERLSFSNWKLDVSSIRISQNGNLEVKAIPSWNKGWGVNSFSWYFITVDGKIRS